MLLNCRDGTPVNVDVVLAGFGETVSFFFILLANKSMF